MGELQVTGMLVGIGVEYITFPKWVHFSGQWIFTMYPDMVEHDGITSFSHKIGFNMV